MQDDTDADFFRIPRLRTIIRGVLSLLHLRTERVKAQDRGDTIVSVAAVLSDSGRNGTVVSRQRDDAWLVTLGPAATPPAPIPSIPEIR